MTQTYVRALAIGAFTIGALLTLGACTSAEEKQRRATAAMVAQAKADAAAESTFVQDSLKLMTSITVDTIEIVVPVPRGATDADGNSWADTIYKAITRTGASCVVDSVKFKQLTAGDTLSCQWEKGQ